jgi:tRNA(Phe) wybutosine-synthesizing methylase Tyw3
MNTTWTAANAAAAAKSSGFRDSNIKPRQKEKENVAKVMTPNCMLVDLTKFSMTIAMTGNKEAKAVVRSATFKRSMSGVWYMVFDKIPFPP